MGNGDEWKEKLRGYFEGQRMVPILMKEITADDVGKIKEKLTKYALESSEEITLLIDTNGGDTQAGLSLVDFLRLLGVPTKGIVIYRCKSMGVGILQGCTTRFAYPHTSFYIHSSFNKFCHGVGASDEELVEEFRIHLQSARKVHDQYINLLAERTRRSAEEIVKMCKQGDKYSWHFTAQEAKELNFIDGIITEPLFKKGGK